MLEMRQLQRHWKRSTEYGLAQHVVARDAQMTREEVRETQYRTTLVPRTREPENDAFMSACFIVKL